MSESQHPEEGSSPGPPPGYGSPPPPPPSAPPPPPPPPSYSSPPPPNYGSPAPPSSGQSGGAGYAGAAPYAGQLAEWPKRAAAFAIDVLGPLVAWFILFFFLSAISDVLGLLVGVLGFFGLFAFILYNSYLNGQTGQSIGKQQVGIRLVRESDGQYIGGGMGIARYFVHVVDGIPCYLGYLWPLWDEKKQTFADKILGTVVLDDAKR